MVTAHKRPLVFLDTETTGLHPTAEVWEFAAIRREPDGTETTDEFFTDVDLRHADPKALDIGGFYDRHPWGVCLSGGDGLVGGRGEYQHDAAYRIASITHGATLVGAVPSFDAAVLERLLRSTNIPPAWHHRLRCVETMTEGFLSRPVGGLADCAKALMVEPGPEHQAMGDAVTAMRIYDAIMAGGAK